MLSSSLMMIHGRRRYGTLTQGIKQLKLLPSTKTATANKITANHKQCHMFVIIERKEKQLDKS